MYHDEIARIIVVAQNKWNFLKSSKSRYLLLSALAGIYVGFGILLIFTIGGLLAQGDSLAVRLVMGLSFGIALSLVIMAGSELFTGNNMVMTIGNLERTVGLNASLSIYFYSFVGNLAGSVFIAYLFWLSGLAQGSTAAYITKIAQVKTTLPWLELLVRGILCNTLVCLAMWCFYRMKEETSKLIMVFWCLFAFITTGFEHSVANMTLLAVAKMISPDVITLAGIMYNLAIVTLGNFIGGAFLIGASYWYISKK